MITEKNMQKKNYKGFIIYKLINPKGQVYIGATHSLSKRIKLYKSSPISCKNQRNLYSSLSKYGMDKHKVEILYRHPANKSLNLDLASIIEQMYIRREYFTNSDNLLNLMIKGVSRIGRKEVVV